MKHSTPNHIFRPNTLIYRKNTKKTIKHSSSSSSSNITKQANFNPGKYLIKFPDMSRYLKYPNRSSNSTGESNQNSQVFSHENVGSAESKPWNTEFSDSEIHGNALESITKNPDIKNWELCTDSWSFTSINRRNLEKKHISKDKNKLVGGFNRLNRSLSVCFSIENGVLNKKTKITSQNHDENDKNHINSKKPKRLLLKKDKVIKEGPEIDVKYYFDINREKLCIVSEKNLDLGEVVFGVSENECLFDVICNKIHPFVRVDNGKLVLDSPFFSDKIISGEDFNNVRTVDLTKILIKLQSAFRGYRDRKKIRQGQGLTIIKQIHDMNFKITFNLNSKDKILSIFIDNSQSKYSIKLTDPIPLPFPYHRSIKSSLMYHNDTLALNTQSSSFLYFTKLSSPYQQDLNNEESRAKNSLKKITKKTISKISLVLTQTSAISQSGLCKKIIYNRILFRKAIKKHGIIYQMCMHAIRSKNQDDVLVFTIKNTEDDHNSHRFMIDLLTLTQITGLASHYLPAIANFVANYMIIIKDVDIIYLDTSTSDIGISHIATKIQSVWRGVLIRKTYKIDAKVLAYKRKVRFCMEIWTCLGYLSKEFLVVKFVRGIDVVEFLIKKMFIDDKYQMGSIDEFLVLEVYPFLKPAQGGSGKILVGMPEIYCNVCLGIQINI